MTKTISLSIIAVLTFSLIFLLTKENRRLKLENKSYREAVARNIKDLEKYEEERNQQQQRISQLLSELREIHSSECLDSYVDNSIRELLVQAGI